MKTSLSSFLQSKYLNPALNSAIYDGPIRIYFSQMHETQALKIYFYLQQKLSPEITRARELSKVLGSTALLMVYPTQDIFQTVFPSEQGMTYSEFDGDHVIGLNGPLGDHQMEDLVEQMRKVFKKWNGHRVVTTQPESVL